MRTWGLQNIMKTITARKLLKIMHRQKRRYSFKRKLKQSNKSECPKVTVSEGNLCPGQSEAGRRLLVTSGSGGSPGPATRLPGL